MQQLEAFIREVEGSIVALCHIPSLFKLLHFWNYHLNEDMAAVLAGSR